MSSNGRQGFIVFPGRMTEAEREALKRQWEERYGPDSPTFIVMSEGVTFTPVADENSSDGEEQG